MYAKLALRNAKRSAKGYLIYLLTLTLSVGLFYGFLSITSPVYNSSLPIKMDLEYFSGKMKIIIPLIAVLLVFLISYVNRYMIGRRKKEFALQITMGMEQRTVAFLFFIETLLMGILAVAGGIVLGILLSQIVSAVVLSTFQETYRFHFSVFPDTVGWTLLFFSALFVIIGLRNVRVIRKQKIIDMLNDTRKTESASTIRDMLLRSLILAAFFAAVILALICKSVLPFWNRLSVEYMLPAGICLLGTSAFLVLAVVFMIRTRKREKEGSLTAGILSLASLLSGIALLCMTDLFESLLRSGLITGGIHSFGPPLLAAGMIWFSILSFFSCFSWLLKAVKGKSASFRYRHLFLLGQIISKMDTNSKTMAVLTCVLLCALVLLGWLPAFSGQVEGYLRARTTSDVAVFTQYLGADDRSALPKANIDGSYLAARLKKGGYTVRDTAAVRTRFLKDGDFTIRIVEDMPILAVSASDFNALAELSGKKTISLPDDRFAVAWDNTALPSEIGQFDESHWSLQVKGSELEKAGGADFTADIGTGLFGNKKKMIYILPDNVCEKLTTATVIYHANVTRPLDYAFAEKLRGDMTEWLRKTTRLPEQLIGVSLKTLELNEGNSNLLMIRLGGAYTSLVLILICLTVLSLQQLTDASEHKQRFGMIKKLGVDENGIGRSVRRQMTVWYGMPVLTAFVGAGAALVYLGIVNYRDYIPYVSIDQFIGNVLSVYGVFILVLICYFAATYTVFRRNIRT